METACAQTITLLYIYIYLYVWGLDLRLNNINYSCWYFYHLSIIIPLYWTSETLFSSSITTSEYLIYDSLTQSLSHNIRTWSLFLRLSNIGPSLSTYSLLSLTKRQHCLLVKKNCQTLGIKDILVRQRKPSCLFVPKLTSVDKYITLCRHC